MKNNYINFLKKYLSSNEDAYLWCLFFTLYLHTADDLVDNPSVDKKYITKFLDFAPRVFTYPFYVQHSNILFPLICAGSLDYYTSVMFEDSKELWKRERADVLRQNINSVYLAVIEIVSGYDKKREAALEIQEISYLTHHDSNGNAV